jgi:putative selenate reductase molybdopterin-binding subunit
VPSAGQAKERFRHEEDVVRRMKQAFQALGYDGVSADSYGSILGRIRGKRPGKTILLDGHIDTVPVPDESKWTHAPYGGELAEGRIYGRGASDVGAGAGADTVLSQIAAETLGVTLDKITITSGDTDFTPFDVGAYASSTTIISGGAVKKAAAKVRDQVLAVAAKMLETTPENLICRDNCVFSKCEYQKSISIAEVARHATYREKMQIMDCASHFNTDSPPPFCAQSAEVEVDTETGKIRVLHLVSAVDCGIAINPIQAEGQVEGAVAQSLVFGLAEEMILDRSGRMVNANFADYKMFLSKDMPRMITILVPTEEPLGPYGAKSIAEVPINTATPAVINAVYNAIGIRFRKLPVRPEDVLQALAERAASRAAD